MKPVVFEFREGDKYLDFNASTPISPKVAEAMQPFLAQYFCNPSSLQE